jgi:hypothetical protein
MDLENPFYYVIESDKGVEFREEIPVYTFKSTDQKIRTTGFGELVANFGKFNLQLSNVETFKSGKYAISTVDLNPTTIIYTNPNPQVLLDNAELTFRKRNAGAKPTADQLENLKTQIKNLFPSSNEEEDRIEVSPSSILNSVTSQATSGQQQPATNTPTLYSWTGPKEFNEKISQIETKLSEKEEEMQKEVVVSEVDEKWTEELNNILTIEDLRVYYLANKGRGKEFDKLNSEIELLKTEIEKIKADK